MMLTSNPDVIFQAAVQAYAQGDVQLAESLCQEVLRDAPRHADALHMLALVFSETGRREEAVGLLQTAIRLKPDSPPQWVNLGEIYRAQQDFAKAVECQLAAIRLQPNIPEAHYNLSRAYHGWSQFENAIVAAQRAVELRPAYAEGQFHLGNLLQEDGQFERAIEAYQVALFVRPAWPDAHVNVAAAWQHLGQPLKAVEHYREALRLDPKCRAAEFSLGVALAALGQVAEAKAAYHRADATAGSSAGCIDPMAVLQRETLPDVIAPDQSSIDQYQSRVLSAVQRFADARGAPDLAKLHTDGAFPRVMLAYHGGNVRPIMERYAEAIAPLIPQVAIRKPQGKATLGIVVSQHHEGVFAQCWGRIAERLSRELLNVRLVCSRSGARVLQNVLSISPQDYVLLPARIDEAARVLREHEFDWLQYWEIGTDNMNYYLPFFQPAAGQSGCWGWPVTSGNPRVDAYLSCEQLEPPGAQEHYTEELILLKHLPTYYIRPPAPQGPLTKRRFGVDDRQRLYLCTQNVRKYHPDFDALLANLLRTDMDGVLLIIGDSQPAITELLLDRFRRTMPNVIGRVRVMPRLERDEYLALVAVADVMLDTLHYGGGANTVYDAVAVGTPIVTLPGEFQRGRWAMAVNRRLGLPTLIAGTPAEYVSIAIEVARNADLRESLRRQILEAGANLFEDQAVVKEHDEHFSQAIADVRSE